MNIKRSAKNLVIGTVATAMLTMSVGAFADASSSDSSLTQLVAAIYGQMKAAYTETNARLQQFDDYMTGSKIASATVVLPASSAAVELGTQTKGMMPSTYRQVPATVQLSNSTTQAQTVMAQIPYSAAVAAGDSPAVLNQYGTTATTYLPWYKLNQSNVILGGLLNMKPTVPTNTPASYLANLTTGLFASDSIVNGDVFKDAGVQVMGLMDMGINNNYFNFMNYFAPMNGSYNDTIASTPTSAKQTNIARGYAEYVSLANQPIGSDIASVLSQYNPSGSGKMDKNKAKALASVIYSDQYGHSYQKYQLAERQFNASRSMVNGLMSQVWAERAPVKGPNMVNAVKTIVAANPADARFFNPDGTASPMQMERYTRLHRVENQQWFDKMSTASPATVAREQLYVSAQLLAAQQQAHEDSEKLLMASLLSSEGYVNGTLKQNLSTSETSLKGDLCQAIGSKLGACGGSSAAAKQVLTNISQ